MNAASFSFGESMRIYRMEFYFHTRMKRTHTHTETHGSHDHYTMNHMGLKCQCDALHSSKNQPIIGSILNVNLVKNATEMKIDTTNSTCNRG